MHFRLLAIALALLPLAEPVLADGHFGVEFRYVNVMPGQTLGQIVSRIYPVDGAPRHLIVREVVRLNPHAFVDLDPNRMVAGVKLVLPRSIDLLAAGKRKVGLVTRSIGEPGALDAYGGSRRLAGGDGIYVGDLLRTDAQSRLHLRMEDGARIYLRACSEFRIEDYIYEPGRTGRSRLQLVRGGVATSTGRIGREFGHAYALATPVATIGVRGTEYAVEYCADRECRPCATPANNAAGRELHVGVAAGEIGLGLNGTPTSVKAGQYLAAGASGQDPTWLERDPLQLVQLIENGPQANPQARPATHNGAGETLWWLLGAIALVLLL